MDRIHPLQHSEYEGYFSAADAAFRNGQVDSTKKGRKTCWKNWCYFVRHLGVEPWIQDATYQQQVLCLKGFAACVRSVRYGRGKQVAIFTVSEALSAVGTTVALAYEGNTTKAQGEKYLLPLLAQMMEGWRKEDPPTKKNCQRELMYQILEKLGMAEDATEMVKAVGDCTVITFYYLVRVGEYTAKNK